MPEEITEPVLRLSTIAPKRRRVELESIDIRTGDKKIDLYEMHTVDDFGVAMHHRLNREGERFQQLMGTYERDLTEDEGAELKAILVELSDLVLDAPTEVKATLTDIQRIAVVNAFTTAPRGVLPGAPEARASSTMES